MTKDAEQDLFRRIARASGEEREQLRREAVEAFLWLVPVNASRFGHYHREDLEQEGAMALYRAVDGFDVNRGLRFSTYAVHWLRQAFHQYLYNHCSTVRLPVYLHKVMARVRQGKPLDGLSDRVVETARTLNGRHTLPIDGAMDMESPEPEERPQSELMAALSAGLAALRERERYLIEQRYFHGRTYRDLGEEVGVSVERVRQIIQKGLAKMRSPLLGGML